MYIDKNMNEQVGVPHAGTQRQPEEGRSSQPPRESLLVAGVQVLALSVLVPYSVFSIYLPFLGLQEL